MSIVSIMLACYGLAFYLLSLVGSSNVFTFSDALSILFWVAIPLPIALSNIFGLLLYRDPKVPKTTNERYKLSIIYVTRGTNIEAIRRATQQTRAILQKNKNICDSVVYVVSDKGLPRMSGIINLIVPAEYQPENGAKWKARALEWFRIETTKVKVLDDVYLHLDEESVISDDVLVGIQSFVKNNPNKKVIGQGEILYNAHNYGNNPITTAVDCLRTGDDLGRFRLQYKLFNKPLFGIHGSYLVVFGTDYKDLSFDHGGKGSITEDAYFGLIAGLHGFKFDWVDGTIHEQSPFTVRDLIKQRRRWFNGISLLVDDPIVPLKNKWVLTLSHVCWSLSYGSLLWTLASFLMGYQQHYIVAFLSLMLYGAFFSIYMIGSWRNTQKLELSKKWMMRVLNILFFPMALLIESIAIMYAIIRPINTFEVVKK